MAKQMRKAAELFFTFTIPLTYLAFFPLALFTKTSLGFSHYSLAAAGVVISCLGLFLWFGGMANLGGSFGVLPKKQARVRVGLYKFLGHPIYLGIFLAFLGISLALGTWWGIIYDLTAIGVVCLVRAWLEEKSLYG